MKVISIAVAGILLLPIAGNASHRSVFVDCNETIRTEEYVPPYVTSNGTYVSGRIRESNRSVPCGSTGVRTAHYPHQQHYPTHQAPPTAQAVQVKSAPAVAGQCDQLTRMGLGALGGGIAGRYLVGGRKSSKTVLGTTVGAVSGLLVGRVLPC